MNFAALQPILHLYVYKNTLLYTVSETNMSGIWMEYGCSKQSSKKQKMFSAFLLGCHYWWVWSPQAHVTDFTWTRLWKLTVIFQERVNRLQ